MMSVVCGMVVNDQNRVFTHLFIRHASMMTVHRQILFGLQYGWNRSAGGALPHDAVVTHHSSESLNGKRSN